MITFLVFVVAISILVFVHEWGHFIVAKLSGVRVDIFSIGFGPKIFGFTWHGTEYRVAPIPFGGYVKIYGQEPLEEAEGDVVKAEEIARHPDSFASKPLYKRLAVVFAGPVMNMVLCFALMPLVFMVGQHQAKINFEKPVVIDTMRNSPAWAAGLQKGDLVTAVNGTSVSTWQELNTQILIHPNGDVSIDYTRDGQNKTTQATLITNKGVKQPMGFLGIEPFAILANDPIVGKVNPGSPGEKGGLRDGDKIVSLNGEPITFWNEIIFAMQKSEGKPVEVKVMRGDIEALLTVTPEFNEEFGWIMGMTRAEISIEGIDAFTMIKKRYGFVDSIGLGFNEAQKLFGFTIDILKRLFTGGLHWTSLGGPLQIAQASSAAAERGLGDFIYLLAFLSLQLGVMNLLPVPVLDGGHVVFMAIEGIMRKPVPHKIRMISMQVGMVMLLGLMLFVSVNDVNNIWGFGNILTKIRGIF